MICIIRTLLNICIWNMNRKRKVQPKKELAPVFRPLFTAAIRYRDGRNELMRIKNALDIDDARKVAMDALMDVHLILIAELKVPAGKSEPENDE
jgi:hypothetical protein